MNAILLTLIPLIIGVISPEIKKKIQDTLNKLEVEAKITKNPWDNMLIAILKRIANVD